MAPLIYRATNLERLIDGKVGDIAWQDSVSLSANYTGDEYEWPYVQWQQTGYQQFITEEDWDGSRALFATPPGRGWQRRIVLSASVSEPIQPWQGEAPSQDPVEFRWLVDGSITAEPSAGIDESGHQQRAMASAFVPQAQRPVVSFELSPYTNFFGRWTPRKRDLLLLPDEELYDRILSDIEAQSLDWIEGPFIIEAGLAPGFRVVYVGARDRYGEGGSYDWSRDPYNFPRDTRSQGDGFAIAAVTYGIFGRVRMPDDPVPTPERDPARVCGPNGMSMRLCGPNGPSARVCGPNRV